MWAMFSMAGFAQSGTNSPYSQYGLGLLSDQTSGFNRGMNGLGVGFRENDQVNYLNPASYSALDSLTFLFDAGFSGQLTNFKENNIKINAKNADLEYVVAGMRLAKHLGLSFGLLPFTNVGYKYAYENVIFANAEGDRTISSYTYSGNGGFHQVYMGAGWQPFKGLSVGANIAYLWGRYERSVVNSYNDQAINTISKYYTASGRSYKLDLGLQYTLHIAKNDWVTLGGTYTLGHTLNADPQLVIISQSPQTLVKDTTTNVVIKNGLELPTSYGVGLAWNHNNQLKLGVDYSLQQWGKTLYPAYSQTNKDSEYVLSKGMFSDRHKLTIGGEYCKNKNSRHFFQRIRYRVGGAYATPYIKINGKDGPDEMSVSAGLGIPIVNGWNNRSMLNISTQWVKLDAKNFITENSFRINIGITFNERWFAKWKVK